MGNKSVITMKGRKLYQHKIAQQSLAADFEGARGNFGCKCQVQWPRPFKAAEAQREADA